jgi:nitroreductase
LGAPSVFNTQPWRWVVRDDVAQLYADRTRQLRAWAHRPAEGGDGVLPAATAEPVAERKVPVRPFHLEERTRSTSDGEPADRAARYALLFTDEDDPSA